MLIQILLSIFIVFAITRVLIRKIKDSTPMTEFLMWLALWLAGGVVIWWPDITMVIANNLGIGRGVDLIFYVSIIILFYLIFRIYLKIEKMERNITKIVRSNSIKSYYENKE